jgi:hypothetical protein
VRVAVPAVIIRRDVEKGVVCVGSVEMEEDERVNEPAPVREKRGEEEEDALLWMKLNRFRERDPVVIEMKD